MTANGEQPIEAYPLSWPDGWRRTSAHLRTRAKFGKKVDHRWADGSLASWKKSEGLTIAEGTQRVLDSLSRMGVSTWNIVISSNLQGDRIYSKRWDAFYCLECRAWSEPKCSDPECEYCAERPEQPKLSID